MLGDLFNGTSFSVEGDFTPPQYALGPEKPLLVVKGSVGDLENDPKEAGPFRMSQLDIEFSLIKEIVPPVTPEPEPQHTTPEGVPPPLETEVPPAEINQTQLHTTALVNASGI